MSLLPTEWLASVAIKKAVYGIAKGLTGLLAYSKAQAIAQTLGIKIDMEVFQAGLTTLMLAGASFVHDWARLKWPGLKWL